MQVDELELIVLSSKHKLIVKYLSAPFFVVIKKPKESDFRIYELSVVMSQVKEVFICFSPQFYAVLSLF